MKLLLTLIVLALLVNGVVVYQKQLLSRSSGATAQNIISFEGNELPVTWGDLGKQLIDTGVIDKNKLEALYASRGGMTEEMKQLLYGVSHDHVRITKENAGMLLNLLWGLGLANKNLILETGPMMSSGDPARFASTGGWTLAQGNMIDHYSTHAFVVLTQKQQELVERVSKNIYRPCCNNPTYFPDCNHGMAMLGFLELMASQGVSEKEMYRAALVVNTYWFPDQYKTIAKYLNQKGISWDSVDPKEILGEKYSGASGYRQVMSEMTSSQKNNGNGCGV